VIASKSGEEGGRRRRESGDGDLGSPLSLLEGATKGVVSPILFLAHHVNQVNMSHTSTVWPIKAPLRTQKSLSVCKGNGRYDNMFDHFPASQAGTNAGISHTGITVKTMAHQNAHGLLRKAM
jgi:hypothetical protein